MAYARTGVSSSGLYFHCSHKFLQVKIFHISLYLFPPPKKKSWILICSTSIWIFLCFLDVPPFWTHIITLSSPNTTALTVVITSSCRMCKIQTLVGLSSAYSLWSRILCVCVEVVSGFYSNKFIHLPVFLPSFMTLPQRLNIINLMFLELCPFIFLEQSHFENLSGFL